MKKNELKALKPGQHIRMGTIEYVVLEIRSIEYGAHNGEIGVVVSPVYGYWIDMIRESNTIIEHMEVVDG